MIKEFDDLIQPKYDDYIANVSPMAPSMKTLKLLLTLCQPGYRVLDLGSGFSSYMLRYFADRLDLSVIYTVDDNSLWLAKTKDYCDSITNNRAAQLFVTWDALMGSRNHLSEFDVVFVDLGITKARPYYYTPILENFCTFQTLILFDDMHKPSLNQAVTTALSKYDYIPIDVKQRTLDQFGRYCKLIFRLTGKA